MILFIIGAVLGGVSILGIIGLFIFVITRKESQLKKMPVWIFIVGSILIVMALTAIGLIFAGGSQL